MYTELLRAHGLTVEQWQAGISKEYLGQLFWHSVMGPKQNAIIRAARDLTKKKGDVVHFGMRSKLIGGKVVGSAKGINNAGRIEFYEDNVVVNNVRHLVKREDVPMSDQRAMFSILSEMREALIEANRFDLEDSITTALTDTSIGRVQGRYVYGNSAWNATHATALAGIDATETLTVAMVNIAKRKGLIPINAQVKVEPMRTQVGDKYEEWFMFLGHTFPMRDLIDLDAAWKNAELNLPPSPARSSAIFTGSSFKGARGGVLYHEWDRVPLLPGAGAGGIQLAHNLLLGASAGVVGWAQMAKTNEETEDLDHDLTIETHEIRGIKKIVYDRNSQNGQANEDQGLVNVFTPAVAD